LETRERPEISGCFMAKNLDENSEPHVKMKKGEYLLNTVPSRELTYPPDKAYLKMIFLFLRWDMLISWRVIVTLLNSTLTYGRVARSKS